MLQDVTSHSIPGYAGNGPCVCGCRQRVFTARTSMPLLGCGGTDKGLGMWIHIGAGPGHIEGHVKGGWIWGKGPVCISTCPNTSEPWWGPGEGLGMWVHVSTGGSMSVWVGTCWWSISTACESCRGSWRGARHMHKGPGGGYVTSRHVNQMGVNGRDQVSFSSRA